MKENYQLILDKKIEEIKKGSIKPSLLIHSCCAPCSSYVLEYLEKYFDITVFYYNPNIYPPEEFYKRSDEQVKLVENMGFSDKIKVVCADYESEKFYSAVKGYENCPEGGDRCKKCFELRLNAAGEYAKENSFDYFTTTLSISPLKNAEVLNEIGTEIGNSLGVKYLVSDFKKRNGYKRSCEISKEFNLYRQDYCGCVFSKNEREK